MCAAAEGITVMLCKCRSHKMGSDGISAGAAGAAEDGSVSSVLNQGKSQSCTALTGRGFCLPPYSQTVIFTIVLQSAGYLLFWLFLLLAFECSFGIHSAACTSLNSAGSWSRQQSLPSAVRLNSLSSWWLLQKEFGQMWQKDTEAFPQTSQWCHGHSHFPNGLLSRSRQERW